MHKVVEQGGVDHHAVKSHATVRKRVSDMETAAGNDHDVAGLHFVWYGIDMEDGMAFPHAHDLVVLVPMEIQDAVFLAGVQAYVMKDLNRVGFLIELGVLVKLFRIGHAAHLKPQNQSGRTQGCIEIVTISAVIMKLLN